MSEENNIFDEKIDETANANSASAAEENHAMYEDFQKESVSGTVEDSNTSDKTTYTSGAVNTPNQADKISIGLGIASLILGIISLLCFWTCCVNFILGILAIIFGIIQIINSSKVGEKAGKGMAIAGIVTSAISIALFFWMVIAIFNNTDLQKAVNDMENGNPAYYENIFNEIYGEDNPYSSIMKEINEL